jgi:hypothetical protein
MLELRLHTDQLGNLAPNPDLKSRTTFALELGKAARPISIG